MGTKNHIDIFIQNNENLTSLSNRELEEILSEKDYVTGLLNRRMLVNYLLHNKIELNVIFLDIKDFAIINELYGCFKTDSILKKITQRLQNDFKDCTLYKVRTDVFCLIQEASKNTIEDLVKKTFRAFEDSFKIEEELIDVYVTVVGASGVKDLYIKSESTLREAKKNKKDFIIHEQRMDADRKINYSNQNRMKNEIKRLLKDSNGIRPYFQPILCNKSNKIKRYEALLRAEKENGTLLNPALFISVAKSINMYSKITQLMVKKTLEYFSYIDIAVSINLSLIDITEKENVEFILKNVKEFWKPENIIFEILEDESVEIIDEEKHIGNLKEIKIAKYFFEEISKLGCKIAIDDFGSGYSNFINIPKLNPQIIKIDGSIIRNIKQSHMKIMCTTVIDFARKLNCEVVAEFVENEEIQNEIIKLGIDYSQGYFVGKPEKEIIDEHRKKGENMIDTKAFEKIYCHESYLEFLKSKKVRDAQGTLLEYATDEQLEEIKRKNIKDISFLNPTPLHIKNHQQFVMDVYKTLKDQKPNDDFLDELVREENQSVFFSYGWYEKYGIKYNG